jgi:hypothetical protein
MQPQAAVYGSPNAAIPFADRITGIAGPTLQLSQTPLVNPGDAIPCPVQVVKNGIVLDPGGGTPAWTLEGSVVTLDVAAIETDVFLIDYWFQSTGVGS